MPSVDYILIKVAITVVQVIPLRLSYKLALLIADLYYCLSKKTKNTLVHNLRRVLGREAKEKEIKGITRRVFRNFGKYLVEFFRTPLITDKELRKLVNIHGKEYIEEALAKGRGAILLGAHFGNWELGGMALANMGFPLNAIVLEHEDEKLNNLFTKLRIDKGVNPIPLGFALRRGLRALRRNELLAFIADRDIGGDGVKVDFGGECAQMPSGPIVFALKTGAPIIPGYIVRNEDNTHDLYMEKPIEMKITGDKEKDIFVNLTKAVKVFESFIARYPDRWFAFYPLDRKER